MKGDRETMKGDFSRGDAINEPNLNGVLHQQGRVFLDRDWNDQTQIALDWQDGAAETNYWIECCRNFDSRTKRI
jgi:hypothetical protein